MFDWLFDLPRTSPIAHGLGLIAMVAAAGMALGSIKVRKIGLGSAGVLFTGIFAAQFSEPIEPHILAFVREFGLILFVFTIGLQLGPGFFASLRKQGLKLNLMAVGVDVLAAMLTVGVATFAKVDSTAALGLLSGAITNTPSLGATQQMLKMFHDQLGDKVALPGIAYAVAYPGGMFGIIAVLLLIRLFFRINPELEAEQFRREQKGNIE